MTTNFDPKMTNKSSLDSNESPCFINDTASDEAMPTWCCVRPWSWDPGQLDADAIGLGLYFGNARVHGSPVVHELPVVAMEVPVDPVDIGPSTTMELPAARQR